MGLLREDLSTDQLISTKLITVIIPRDPTLLISALNKLISGFNLTTFLHLVNCPIFISAVEIDFSPFVATNIVIANMAYSFSWVCMTPDRKTPNSRASYLSQKKARPKREYIYSILGTPPPPDQTGCTELVPRSPAPGDERAENVHSELDVHQDEDVEEEEEEEKDAAEDAESGSSVPQSHTGSILINAAQKGDVGAVRQVLDNRSVDPDRKTRYQARSALHLACGYGQFSVVEELLLVSAGAV